MFYGYQSPHRKYRLVGWWASGSLDSWLTSWLPTGALEKLVRGLGCQAVPPFGPPSPCLGSICFLRAINVSLSLASARVPSVSYSVFALKQ